jgi:hypothetical protein
MSLLPGNTFANPQTPFYGDAGQGAANSLQSPAEIIPDATLGDANLTLAGEALGTSILSIQGQNSVLSLQAINLYANSAANRTMEINASTDGTDVPLAVFDYTNDNITLGKPLFGGSISLSSATTVTDNLTVGTPSSTVALFDIGANVVNLCNPLGVVGGGNTTYINGTAVVTSSATRPVPSGITLSPTSPTVSSISNSAASAGSLILGSSVASPSTLTVSDAGAGTGQVVVGGNAGSAITMTGGVGGGINSVITNTTASPGSLVLGASTACAAVISIDDLAGADTAVVDIKRGTATGTALRLQGAGTGIAPQISTDASAGGRLNLTASIGNPVPAISITDVGISLELPTTVYSAPTAGNGYGGITQQIINSGNPIGQLPFNITNPSTIGFYQILVRVGDNAAININGQINTFGYWNGSIWVAGGIGYSPPLGTGNLLIWFGSTATSRAQLILQNTGSADLSQVAVYMIPMLSGSIPIMT